MKIALIGADGQLGTDLTRTLKNYLIDTLYYPEFNVKEYNNVKETLSKLAPDIVINTSAYHRVDDCEDNLLEAFEVNVFAVRNLAQVCLDLDAVLVHFSSDYVFDGKKKVPYIENDITNPLSAYGVSKLSGEYFINNILKKFFIIRTSGLYGNAGCWGKGKNFVDSIITFSKNRKTLKVVDDQTVTPTSTEELAEKIKELILTDSFGLYHLTNEGQCTWYEFACEIIKYAGLGNEIIPVDSKTFGAKAKRPEYSVLENRNARSIGISEFSHWKSALENYLGKKGIN